MQNKFVYIKKFIFLFGSLTLILGLFYLYFLPNFLSDIEILQAKMCSFVNCKSKIGEKIFIEQAKAIYKNKITAIAAASITSGMPNCPFSGQSGEVYLRNEECEWSELAQTPTRLCKLGEECWYNKCEACHPFYQSCCFTTQENELIECGVWGSLYGFGSDCYNHSTGKSWNRKTYFCKIP